MCTLLKSFRGTGAHQNAGEEFRERERESFPILILMIIVPIIRLSVLPYWLHSPVDKMAILPFKPLYINR